MQIQLELNDGRRVPVKSTKQFAAIRLTHEGGYIAKGSSSAEEAVKFARKTWGNNGNHHIVVDTHTGEGIAFYPCIEKNWIREQAPPTKSCEECGGGWSRVPGSNGMWVPDHAIDPPCSQTDDGEFGQ